MTMGTNAIFLKKMQKYCPLFHLRFSAVVSLYFNQSILLWTNHSKVAVLWFLDDKIPTLSHYLHEKMP